MFLFNIPFKAVDNLLTFIIPLPAIAAHEQSTDNNCFSLNNWDK